MRPTDENQHGSTRPNLMATSRRASGTDDSILARIERDTGARSGVVRARTSRKAWLLGAAMTVMVLIGALAWLARENARVHREAPQLTTAEPAPPAELAPAPPRQLAAAIIDTPAETVRVAADPHAVLPPLVKLTPAKPAGPPPAPPSAQPRAPQPVLTAAPRTTARAAPPRAKKAAPAPAEAVPVDSDVALLSAIIMHSSKHAAERAETESAGANSGKKPSSAATTATKTTD